MIIIKMLAVITVVMVIDLLKLSASQPQKLHDFESWGTE